MDAETVAQVLDDMGTLLEIRGENPFRCRAYHNAAQTMRGVTGDLADLVAEGRLAELPGIGETIQAKIAQLVTTGHLPAYDDLKRQTPAGLHALLRIPGLGPKKIKALYDTLKVESLADLRAAAEAGKIASLKGFGAKTEANILEGITFVESTGTRILQSTARRLVEPIFEAVRSLPGVDRLEICGSFRRRAETIGDLDLLFASEAPEPVLDAFTRLPGVAKVLGQGPTKASVLLAGGVQCDLRGVSAAQFPFALQYFTGSKAHNIAMRRRAQSMGLKLNEYGLEGHAGSVACADEAAVYKALGLHFIPPELREDRGEIELSEKGELPRLVQLDDLRGTFHCHSDWSDGGDTLAEMAEAARDRGLAYLGIADHSRSAAYAGGLSIERVREQWLAIDELNKKFGPSFRIFKGIECDILADGDLDYPDDILKGFDYVVASIHSLFRLDRDTMTRRIIRAVENPRVTILGHPTGRLLLNRAPYAVDLDAVISAAARAGTCIEINANPHRLDLDDLHAHLARERGVPITINPDAHSTGGLDDLDYGVGVARRAGLGPADIVNTRSRADVETWLQDMRGRRSP